MKHKFPYKWTLKDAIFTKDKGKVFSCFACGGGSTMGYKLAGFDVLGRNEIDPKMMACYVENHKPKYSFLEPIQTFKLRKDLPEELYDLDILDGSPPCSSFSEVGNRSKDWGKEKVFREGQQKQVLDTLFFDFIDLAKELQPKIVIAENVKGLLKGSAYQYYRRVHKELSQAGYKVNAFCLDASDMGVPQRRERVFVIGLRNDLSAKLGFNVIPDLQMKFNEKKIPFGEIYEPYTDNAVTGEILRVLENATEKESDLRYACKRIKGKSSLFAYKLIHNHTVATTITDSNDCNIIFSEKRFRNRDELIKCGTFPIDYNFLNQKPVYLIGMSVPPIMTAQIASNIYDQWLTKL